MIFNIIIPSIQFSDELKFVLKKLEYQSYRNFFVTIVLDKKNTIIPKYKFDLKILVVGKKNMSFKRNFAARQFKSDYIGFLDSDAYPHKNWLKNANSLLNMKNKDAVGGPSIPFPNQKYSELISHYAKRSFFVTGSLSFRKYIAKDRYCDWLEACNFFISRNNYLKYGGMDEKKFLAEDFNFFSKIYKSNKKFKTFYSSKIYIFHKERNFIKFLLQRFSFGTSAFNLINFKKNYYKYQSIYPFFALIFFLLFFGLSFTSTTIMYSFCATLILTEIIIFYEISKYITNLFTRLLTLLLINLANLFFSIGTICGIILKLNNNYIKKIYISSRNNE